MRCRVTPNFWSFLKFLNGVEQTMCCSVPQKLTSFTYLLAITFQITIRSPSVIYSCPPPPNSILFGLSFTKYVHYKFHISTLANSASMKLGVLRHLRQYFSSPKMLTLYRVLIRPWMKKPEDRQWIALCGIHTVDQIGDSERIDALLRIDSKALKRQEVNVIV